MVRDHEVEQFVNNHVLANVSVQPEQFSVKIEISIRRA